MTFYKQQIKEDFLIVIIKLVLLRIAPIFLIPLLTKNLGSEGYGYWSQLSVTITFLLPLVTFNLTYSFSRFLPIKVDTFEEDQSISSIGLGVFFSTTLFGMAIFLLRNWLGDLFFDGNDFYVLLLAAMIPASGLNQVFLDYLRAVRKIKLNSILVLFRSWGRLLLALVLVLFNFHLKIIVSSILLIELVLLIFFLIYSISNFSLVPPSISILTEYLIFSFPLIFTSLGSFLIKTSDRYFIAFFQDVSEVGVYSAAYSLGMLTQSVIAPFTFLIPPIISKHWDKGENKQVEKLISLSLRYYLMIAVPTTVGISVLSKNLLFLISTKEIAERGFPVTVLIASSHLFFGLWFFFTRKEFLLNKTGIIGGYYLVGAAVNLLGNLLLIPRIGLTGAGISTLLSFVVMLVMSIPRKKLGLFNTTMIKEGIYILLFSLIMGGLVFGIGMLVSPLYSILWGTLLGVISYGLFLLVSKLITWEEILNLIHWQ